MDPIVGIDLGTTNSLVACMEDDGPRVIANALGETLTPSVVGIDEDGAVLVGSAARELQAVRMDRCASLFKRRMGADWRAELGGRQFTAEELSSLVLRSLKQDAEACFGRPVERAVISVPAYFNDQQRKATVHAGQMAGLKVERIVNEPTAAAVAYGLHETDEDKLFLVFDLGGGTFDVSLVELFEGALEVRASSGESFLGGEDFTRAMAARLLEQDGLQFERVELESPRMVGRLLQQCELAKRRLSQHDSAVVRMPDREGRLEESSAEVAVERKQFQTWTDYILARVELPIRRVLADARLNREDLDEIILVGGATRMPAVSDAVTRLFGKAPRRRLNPDQVVALGAAVQAGLIAKNEGLKDVVVTDVCPFTLGVEISKQFGTERRAGYFLPIINRNTTIPVSRVERVATTKPNQTVVEVKLYQGEARRVEDNLYLGEFIVQGIPSGPAGQQLDIRFTYDLNGILEAEATVVETGQKVAHVVTRHARGLSQQDVGRAVAEMEKLKRHPREETANRFLLRRAERLYQELGQLERHQLAQMLDGFEQAMELGEADAIERHRLHLQEFLDRFDPGAEAGEDYDDWL
ncbi:MAG TPA: Hsp70 family protein [Pirellulales bacterium]|jgi:molecular chaperone HscC|nr:Hsp70 family protein [Pirellulales bacterium]